MSQPTQIKKLAVSVYRWSQGKKETDIKMMTKHLVKLFYKKGSRRNLKELMRALLQLEATQGGVTKLRLTTRWPLTAETKEKIVKSLGLAKTEIDERINPDLLGGFEARFNDKIINASFKYQLQSLL